MSLLFLLSSVSIWCALMFVGDEARCLSSRFCFAPLEHSLQLLGALCVGFVLLLLGLGVCYEDDSCGLLWFYSLFYGSAFYFACVL